MKKMLSYIGVVILSLFSFYYTDKVGEIVRKNDPIMKEIMANKDNYSVEAVNAIIDGNYIVSGINGKEIDIKESYKKMKKYNKYNEDMYVFHEVNPLLSFTNSYDKYVIGGNSNKMEIALVFKIIDSTNLNKVNSILLDKDITATFFIDGNIIEKEVNKILELSSNNNEIENLGYDLKYTKDKLIYTNNMIEAITRIEPRYCYSDYMNNEVLDLCSSNHMYTVKPTISVSNYPFITVKNNVNSGSIIGFNLDNDTLKELPSIITYLKQKGYKLVTLSELLSEKYVEEK